jgi:hypothetical protein
LGGGILRAKVGILIFPSLSPAVFPSVFAFFDYYFRKADDTLGQVQKYFLAFLSIFRRLFSGNSCSRVVFWGGAWNRPEPPGTAWNPAGILPGSCLDWGRKALESQLQMGKSGGYRQFGLFKPGKNYGVD